MSEWIIVLVGAVLSLITAIVTAIITTILTHRNVVKKWILEERSKLYLSLYENIEQILSKRESIYSKEYMDILVSYKPKMKLLASKGTFNAFRHYYEFVRKNKYSFEKFYEENNPQNDMSRLETWTDDDGEVNESVFLTDEEWRDFIRLTEEYKTEQKPSVDSINSFIEPLYQSMRNDLGSNL